MIMDEAHAVLATHPVNRARRDRGERCATDIWLWGHGTPCSLPSWEERFGVRMASIAAVDLIRGITGLAGFDDIEVPGATGYLDTDYAAKGRAAVACLDDYDGVLVHIEAPDEAGHLGDAAAKVEAVEQIDATIIGPLLSRLRGFDRWRILVAPDHPTPVGSRVHTRTPPPYCLAGWHVAASGAAFDESAARLAGPAVAPGHGLIERFFA
jgi:2,3-bisphosphoglycerate-independent phosphoglycerate mutase